MSCYVYLAAPLLDELTKFVIAQLATSRQLAKIRFCLSGVYVRRIPTRAPQPIHVDPWFWLCYHVPVSVGYIYGLGYYPLHT